MKVHFTDNPYIKVSWREATRAMTDLTNTFFDSKGDRNDTDLLKEAEKILCRLGWSLEEYQDTNRPSKVETTGL